RPRPQRRGGLSARRRLLSLLEVRVGARRRAQPAQHRGRRACDVRGARAPGSERGADRGPVERQPRGGQPEAPARAPLVVLIPGLDSTKEEFYLWESAFLERGMATLSLDGPGQGETGFELNIRPDYEIAVGAVLDAVSHRSELDLSRVGAVGVSLGGYYVVRAAAFEPRLTATAGISGPFQFRAA